ncbi:MAG: hypothetical protein AAGF13_02755 [Pseudomonadota bacterium]
MWFFWSIRQLPRFNVWLRGPQILALVVFLLFEGQVGTALGIEIFALKTAAAAMWLAATCFVISRAESPQWPEVTVTAIMFALICVVIALPDERAIMVLVTGVFAVTLFFLLGIPFLFEPDERAQLPFRWLGVEGMQSAAFGLLAARETLFLAVALWAMAALSVLDWLLWITLGRIALYYFYEWLMILLWAARER